MTSPLLYALTVGPLGIYLWVLAYWHSARRPRVVSGLVDFALLAFGIGGVLVFGPFGQLVTRLIFGKTDLLEWVVMVSALGLFASFLARKSLHRLVVYHVDPDTLRQALDDVLSESKGRFVRTLGGFEDRESGRGLRVEVTKWLRCAVVEAHGRDPEDLIQQVRPRLRYRLRAEAAGPSSLIALTLYGASILVMFAPLIGMFLTQPKARAALRVLIEKLRGV